MELRAGSSTVCVPSTGVYVIEPVGCHGYSSPSIRWTGGVVSLKAVSHLYTGRVLTSETVSDLVVNVILLDDHVAEPSRYYNKNVLQFEVLSYKYKAQNLIFLSLYKMYAILKFVLIYHTPIIGAYLIYIVLFNLNNKYLMLLTLFNNYLILLSKKGFRVSRTIFKRVP